jgi:hypothetical protein
MNDDDVWYNAIERKEIHRWKTLCSYALKFGWDHENELLKDWYYKQIYRGKIFKKSIRKKIKTEWDV